MKKPLIIAISGVCISVYALPTYEPFTEFAPVIAQYGTNQVASQNGVPLGTNASGGVYNCIDLAAGGYTAPGGEQWGSLNFSGTSGIGVTAGVNGVDTAVISNATIFTSSALSSLLPAAFPGFPASGTAITNMVENAAQPLIWNGTDYAGANYIVGNSAVLTFSQDITRPTNGTMTVYVSYLFSVAQQGANGAGNDGRYLGFLAASNLVEGVGSGGAYTNWAQMFNAYGGTNSAPNYASHGVFSHTANVSTYIEACDSSAGKSSTNYNFSVNYGTPIFIVGSYQFSSAANVNDTNAVWVNPALGSFGGSMPPPSPVAIDSIPNSYKMSDIAGLVLINRVGSGALGGIGTNYIANLLIGTTWSYVTGGPEFTNQPVSAIYSYGGTVTWSGTAVAAGQSVSYQWQHIVGTTTNLTDGVGTAGGGASVSGSATKTLTLTGVTPGDAVGVYQLVATASGTGYTLTSQPVVLITDPFITSSPVNATANYGATAKFTATATTSQSTMTAQWYFGSTPLANGIQADGSTVSGATRAINGSSMTTTLTLSNLTYQEAGNYYVVETNNVNAAASSPATLVVNDPIIVTQPNANPLVILPGGSGSISVVAAGTGLTYQWYGVQHGQLMNGEDFFGVSTPTLTITNAQASDADYYYVEVGGSSTQTVQSTQEMVYVGRMSADPNNLGQGDWIWEMSSCERALGVSTPQAVIDYEAGRGMQWVTVKAGDGTSEWSQWNSAVINEAHAKGMKIFAWVYAYGNYTNTTSGIYSSEAAELNVAKWTLSVGGDGLIIDAESEYQGQGAAASAYASGIKAAYPNLFLAYAPFPYISYHSTFPYVQFGQNCDAVMPQDYWADIGVTVTNMVNDMDGEWSAWQNSLTGANTNAIKPIVPIGQGWNFTGYAESISEVTNFVWLLQNDPSPAGRGGYHGVSYWECSQHPAAVWTGMARSLILAGTNSVTWPQGSNVTFAVSLPAGGNFKYQWSFNQGRIAGATGSSYTVTNIQQASAGVYSVLATNANGCTMNYSAILSVVSPLVNAPGSVVAPMNLVNWWTADGNADDIYGVTNATPQNGVYYTNGEVGPAVHLDGATGFLNTGAPGLAPPWTVCLWVNRENAPGSSAALFSDGGTNVLKLEQNNGTREVGVTVHGVADYTFPGGYAVPQNTWTHLAFVDTGSQIQLYANGVLQGVLVVSFPLPRAFIGLDSFSQPDAIGSKTYRQFTDYLKGSLDEIQVFQRALGASEISAIYSADSSGLVRAPEFTGIAPVPGGIQLNLRGQTGKNFTLYLSSDLVNWTTVGTYSNPGGTVQFLDLNPPTGPQNFYRISEP